uniref:M23 family metallopeptidase n=1 Tax=uncultured Bacteroides sp. TaxID=162156 RepID=UPI00280B16DD|nr:M23 family metallopeptidase [uncultured Bacteroides sp.]
MKLLYYFLLLMLPASAFAQSDRLVKVSYERSSKGEITFYAETDSHTPYTVSLSFSRLTNTTYPEGTVHEALAHFGKTRLLTLRPAVENVAIGFSYRYTYKKGNCRLKADTNFVYLFPLAEGRKVRVNRMVSLDNFLGKEGQKRVTGLAFRTTAGDTIFAARGGEVTEVSDDSASKSEGTSFQATENYVEVFHKDGTFARYKLFRDGGIFVSPGEDVIPGQPLGIIGGENYKQGSHLRFNVYCPDLKGYSYIPDFYLSSEKTGKPEVREIYISEHPVPLIMQEMSKKEKKKFLSKK